MSQPARHPEAMGDCVEDTFSPTRVGDGNSPKPRSAKSGYIWLAYSAFFFIEPVLRNDLRYWLINLGIYAVFLALYIGFEQRAIKLRRWVQLVGFFALGTIALPLNPGGSCFFIYVAAFLPFILPNIRILSLLLAAECIFVGLQTWYVHRELLSPSFTVGMILIIASSNTLIAQQKRADSKLRLAHEEIEQLAAVAERERIARDLHDVLGHTLSVIVLKSELAGRLLDADAAANAARARVELADVEATARLALSEVREAITGYRSQGIEAELEQTRRTLAAAGVACTVERRGDVALPHLPATSETVLALALREAATNIVRHAHATECTISLTAMQGHPLTLVIHDDGTGGAGRTIVEGNGLRGMRERLTQLRGSLTMDTAHGTSLTVTLPLQDAVAAASARGTASPALRHEPIRPIGVHPC